ncbi:MAG TPA: kelch repeat-containing protein [Chloroflexota bacterium]|nr:kelch repeat-containing protein [Chloroflexota bacterium]
MKTTRTLLRSLLTLPVALLVLAPSATHAAAAAGTWTMTGSLHTAATYQSATLLPNGQVLVAGGADANGLIGSAELYNPSTGKWTVTGSLNQARVQFTATLLPNGLVLAAGGCDDPSSNCSSLTATAELYNPSTGKWTMTGSMHEPRWTQTATLLPSGKVLVAGGAAADCYNVSCSEVQASAELYDPHTGVWTVTGSMHQARTRHTATLLPDGQVLVAGGVVDTPGGKATFKPLASAELYNPHTGKWTLTGSMHVAGSNRGATLLPNGLVLVYGGGPSKDAELYHPHTGSWATTGSLFHDTDYETGQTPALLGNGEVLVVSGSLTKRGTAELYSPQTGAWTLTGSLHAFPFGVPMTVLPSGQVLVADGSPPYNNSIFLASAELYNP